MVAMDSIGRYRLVRRIGAGSFATVWLGHDDDLDVPVAVKVLADNWASNSDVHNRFLAEARILRRIHDPRLVQVYDIGTLDDGRPYFVMDYIDGGSMNDLRQQGIHPIRALRLCAEACRALDVLHGHDIIHRDVTPGNLLLSKTVNGGIQVLIADLGVAKSMLDAVGATMTAGTPSYMAPEQAMGVAPLDRRADIYSLTAVTYAMLTGRPPFLVRRIADILARHPSRTPEPIAERLGAPSTLDGVMLSGLAADRNRRPPSALLLADGLQTIADQMDAVDTSWQAADGNLITHTPQTKPPMISEITVSELPPATALEPSFFPLPSARLSGFEPASPYPAPVGPPVFQPSPQPVTGGHPSSGNSYGTSQLTTPPPEALTPSRPASYYVLLGVSALALFAISMFITILVLR
jgi:eukaryotic-like serine/threonine-protein kinase